MSTLPITQRNDSSWTCPFCDRSIYTHRGALRAAPGDTCDGCGATADEDRTTATAKPSPELCPTCGREL